MHVLKMKDITKPVKYKVVVFAHAIIADAGFIVFRVLSTDDKKLLKLLKSMPDKIHFKTKQVVVAGLFDSTEYIYNSLISTIGSKIRKESTTHTYVYKKNEIPCAISLADGYSSSQIKPKDVAFACSRWGFNRHKSTDCKNIFDFLSSKYDAVAVYHGSEVVAWMFESISGAFIHLYTMPDHRHKGLGAFVVQEMTKKQLAKGRIPFAYVVMGNKGGEKTFTQVGFTKVVDCDRSHLGINRSIK